MSSLRSQGQTVKDLDLTITSPAGYVSLDKHEASNLSKFIKQCHVDKKDLKDTKSARDLCVESMGEGGEWWQSPQSVIIIALGSFIVGGITGAVFNGN